MLKDKNSTLTVEVTDTHIIIESELRGINFTHEGFFEEYYGITPRWGVNIESYFSNIRVYLVDNGEIISDKIITIESIGEFLEKLYPSQDEFDKKEGERLIVLLRSKIYDALSGNNLELVKTLTNTLETVLKTYRK